MVRETSSVLKGSEVKELILTGSKVTADAVATTYGPWGKNVALTRIYNPPHITKDGVTVAKDINLLDPVQNIAAQIIKAAADKTALVAGDGTTSTTILTNELVKQCIAYLQTNPEYGRQLRRELEDAVFALETFIDSQSMPISLDETDASIHMIAMSASNGDQELANLVTNAYRIIGIEGLVTVTESRTYETFVDTTSGIKIDRSHISPVLIGNTAKTERSNPRILVTDLKISTTKEAIHLIQLQEDIQAPMLVICEDVEREALEIIAYNKLARNIPIDIIRSPYIAEARYAANQDLAIATGATYIDSKQGWTLLDTSEGNLGSADSVTITLQETNILGRKGDPAEIEERINFYKTKIEEDNAGLTPNYKRRIAILTGGAAVIYVGGANDIEVAEKKDRLDDTIKAVRAALVNGVVSGGGIAFMEAADTLDKKKVGELILRVSLEELPKYILRNKLNKEEITDKELKVFLSESAKSKVLDPALVVSKTIANAVGAAIMLFNTDCVIIKREENGN